MRQVFMRLACILVLALCSVCWAAAPAAPAAPKVEAPAPAAGAVGEEHGAAEVKHQKSPMEEELNPGTLITTILIFVALFAILRWKAWGPIMLGLKNREEAIRDSI